MSLGSSYSTTVFPFSLCWFPFGGVTFFFFFQIFTLPTETTCPSDSSPLSCGKGDGSPRNVRLLRPMWGPYHAATSGASRAPPTPKVNKSKGARGGKALVRTLIHSHRREGVLHVHTLRTMYWVSSAGGRWYPEKGVCMETENRHSGFQFCSKATDELWMESASKCTIVNDEPLSKSSFYSDWGERAILY